jgi:hypothetical protein
VVKILLFLFLFSPLQHPASYNEPCPRPLDT